MDKALEFIRTRIPQLLGEEFVKYVFIALLGAAGTYGLQSIPMVRHIFGVRLSLSIGELSLVIGSATMLTILVVRLWYRTQIARLELALRTDDTTNILNEKALPGAFEATAARCRREGVPFCLITFDIDNFKDLNSQYGYQDANYILGRVVQQVRAAIRPEDVLVRRHRSGDEFVIIALNNFLARGEMTADRIRQHIEQYRRFKGLQNPNPVSITISAGVAECNVQSDSLDSVLRRADTALSGAKATRNSVQVDETYESVAGRA